MTPITPSHSSSGLRSSARLGEQRADTSRTDPLAVRPAHGYAGDISPQLACQWWQSGEAVLVDVRTDAEREWVGHVPGALPLAWKQWPGMAMNPGFDKGLRAAVPEGGKVVLLCAAVACVRPPQPGGPVNWALRPTTFWKALKAMPASRANAVSGAAGVIGGCRGSRIEPG